MFVLLQLLLACGTSTSDTDKVTVTDEDADGIALEEGDCNDSDASVYPGADEQCDGVDNNCDGEIDEDLLTDFYADADGDGFGLEISVEAACEAPDGYVEMMGDCDDADDTVNPDATEECDEIDNNCNGLIDDADPAVVGRNTVYLDYDGDGYGNTAFAGTFCGQPEQYVDNDLDCDDLNALISPEGVEVCDEVDNNCDGLIDDADITVQYSEEDNWYADLDMDGYGDADNWSQSCVTPPGVSDNNEDCDDTKSEINPGMDEVCDSIDNDCDALVDDEDELLVFGPSDLWYVDADADTYGNINISISACLQPAGFVSDANDCDDLNPLNNPMGTEVCDGVDNNCDALVDDADPAVTFGPDNVWYIDDDGDTFGDADASSESCSQPVGYVGNTDDCDDSDAGTSPLTVWYADMDMDGFGDANDIQESCEQPMGYILDAQDCDDTSDLNNPVMGEICGDGIDNNCDGDTNAATCDVTQTLGMWASFEANGDEESFFGKQIRPTGNAVSGVANTIAISANRANSNSFVDNGAVYFYDAASMVGGTAGTTDAVASIHGSVADDIFGTIVAGIDPVLGASSSDVNGDGIADVAISATLSDTNGNKSGSVYIFHGGFSGELDAETDADAILLGEGANDQAGLDISFIDANADGNADLLIGAPNNSTVASLAGAAYLVYGPISSGTLESQAAVSFYGDSASDYVGSAVLNTGDINGDGLDDFAIAAYREDPVDESTLVEFSNAGKVYVFTGAVNAGAVLADADLTLYGDMFAAYAGREMSKAGDVNGDGLADFLVGARSRPTTGSVFLVSGDTGLPAEMWLNDATARLDGLTSQAEFGKSSTALGDINGDGFGDIAVGAKKEDGVAVDSGAAYIYYGPLKGAYGAGAYHGVISGDAGSHEAGISMSNVGDIDGSGVNDLMVGAYFEDTNGYRAGAAYLLLGADLQQ